MPLRCENGLVYHWCVDKDNELDLASARDFLREEAQFIILYEMFFKVPQCELDSVDEVKSRRKTVTKDVGNMSVEELVSWAEEEAAMASKACDDDISVTSVVDKGKGLADKGKGLVDKGKKIMVDERNAGRKSARIRNSGIVIKENVNPTVSKDDDSDSDIDMEQRFKGSAELEEMYKGNTDSESEYFDKFVDYLFRDEDELISLRKRNIESDTMIEHEEYMEKLIHQLRVGEKYVDVEQLKECLTYHSLANGFSLWFYRSSKEQVIARCRLRPEKLKDNSKGKQRKGNIYPSAGRDKLSNYPFRCYGKMMVTEKSFQVISLNEEHTCVRNFKYGTLVNCKWIGKHFGHKIRQNSQIKLHEIADLVMKKYKCIVSLSQCRNAKKFALNEVKLGVTVNPDDKTYFDRHAYWNGLTLISDQHKGLIESVKDVMLLAEHRKCARHIYEGFSMLFLLEGTSLTLEMAVKHSELISSKEPAHAKCGNLQQPAKRGRPKKNVENVQSKGDAAFNMDESSSQVRQGGEPGIDVDSVRVEPGINVGSVGVESSTDNETVRSKSLDDFVSVRSEGIRTATRGRGGQTLGLGVRRVTSEGTPAARIGWGSQTLGLGVKREQVEAHQLQEEGVIGKMVWTGRLGRWFGLGDETQPNEQPTPVRKARSRSNRGNSQVKDNKIDLLVQQYEQFVISEDESIDNAFARFNTIITSLKAFDEGYSSKNYVRNFLRARHPKGRAKVTAIEESKDLTSLSLDELIGNLKVHEMIIKKDYEIVNAKGERKSLPLKAKKESSDEECSTSGSEDEEYAMAVRDFKKCGDPNHLIRECPKPLKDKNQRAFVVGSWSDSGKEDDEKAKDETCLVTQASNEVCFDSSYFSDENSSIDDFTLDNEYDKLCKMSLKIITKNKQLKVTRNNLENELSELKLKLSTLEKNKGVDLECINCQSLKIDNKNSKKKLLNKLNLKRAQIA
ncbi:hypothetical protein Tco_0245826 [Tanacetum coccineum]